MDGPPPSIGGYKIPKRSQVSELILEILSEARTIRSQTLLHNLVKHMLRDRYGGSFKLSAGRLRRIAASTEGVDIIAHCRDLGHTSRKNNCPVCGEKMSTIKNATLYGWTVNTGKMCDLCRYWTGKWERKPIRYVFTVDIENIARRREGRA